jgi:hypothetical protein
LSGFGIFGFVSSGGEFGQVFCGVGGFEEGRFSGWFDDVLVRRV